jgi:hypothetical protein
MDVRSDSDIPAFRRHATIWLDNIRQHNKKNGITIKINVT